jgi:hypothetical protein
LEEVDLGENGGVARPTYISAKQVDEEKVELCTLLREFTNCFAWDYTKMPGLGRDLVEHTLPIKPWFRPFKEPIRRYNTNLLGRIKEEIEHLILANFIGSTRYAEWVSNIVPVEKKNTGKIRICVDFRNLNRVTPSRNTPCQWLRR